jgi:hypothetical protein
MTLATLSICPAQRRVLRGKAFWGKSREKVTHRLERGENLAVIAMRLTKKICWMIPETTNFNRELIYPRLVLS